MFSANSPLSETFLRLSNISSVVVVSNQLIIVFLHAENDLAIERANSSAAKARAFWERSTLTSQIGIMASDKSILEATGVATRAWAQRLAKRRFDWPSVPEHVLGTSFDAQASSFSRVLFHLTQLIAWFEIIHIPLQPQPAHIDLLPHQEIWYVYMRFGHYGSHCHEADWFFTTTFYEIPTDVYCITIDSVFLHRTRISQVPLSDSIW